ncbi:MAG: SUF system NifU family Fe-S cluster assembly protein [Thermotogota bacterium]|nr:SUF system NifU family Fe-S cluster assembly protein [Thermotogota bacterium]
MNIRDLYSDIILKHYQNSSNKGVLDDATDLKEGANLSCGDELKVFMNIENSTIEKITFEGNGCAISIASASVMTEILKGKNLKQANDIIDNFIKMLKDKNYNGEILGDAVIFESVKQFPVRIKCASLAWHTAKEIIENKKNR